jgi:hypothetical protein
MRERKREKKESGMRKPRKRARRERERGRELSLEREGSVRWRPAMTGTVISSASLVRLPIPLGQLCLNGLHSHFQLLAGLLAFQLYSLRMQALLLRMLLRMLLLVLLLLVLPIGTRIHNWEGRSAQLV